MRKTVIIVTHDMGEAFALADRVGVLDEGRLVACDRGAVGAPRRRDPRVRRAARRDPVTPRSTGLCAVLAGDARMTLFAFWLSHRGELAEPRCGQHVLLVAVSTSIAVALGVPLGIFAARRPRLASPLMAVASIVQTIPSLAMFGFLLPVPFIGGVGARAALVVLILYGLLPIVRTTIAGLRGIDPSIREAGVAMGMTPRELLRQVELPLALPSIVAGIRVAAVVGVGSATIAAAIGAGGLGEYIYRGLSMVDTTVILAGAIPAALLALAVDGAAAVARAAAVGAAPRSRPRAAATVAAAAVAVAMLVERRRRTARAAARSSSARRISPSSWCSASCSRRRSSATPACRSTRRLNLGGTLICDRALDHAATSTSTSSTPAPR